MFLFDQSDKMKHSSWNRRLDAKLGSIFCARIAAVRVLASLNRLLHALSIRLI